MDCRISGSSNLQRDCSVSLSAWRTFSGIISSHPTRIWFRYLPIIAVTSVYLSLHRSGIHNQRKCSAYFLVITQKANIVPIRRTPPVRRRAKAKYAVAAAAVLIFSSASHHLLQRWQKVHMRLSASSDKSLFINVARAKWGHIPPPLGERIQQKCKSKWSCQQRV